MSTQSSPIFELKAKFSTTYFDLISTALNSLPEKKMRVAQIYRFIQKNYEIFSRDTKRWQNSVRHALSVRDNFVRVPPSEQDKARGGFWTIVECPPTVDKKKNTKRILVESKRHQVWLNEKTIDLRRNVAFIQEKMRPIRPMPMRLMRPMCH